GHAHVLRRMPVDLVDPHTDKTFEPEWITSPQGYKVAAPVQTSPSDPKKKITTSYGVASGEAKPSDDAPLARNTSEKFDIGRNFCNKVWNASRFAIGILTKPLEAGASDDGEPALIDRWMLSRLADATDQINDALDEYQFANYSQALYDVVWRDFCDWYLEAIKPTVASSPRQRATLRATLDALLRLLHPVVPFLTETIYETLRELDAEPIDGLDLAPARTGELLCTAGWPACSMSVRDTEAEAAFDRVRDLVAGAREVRAKHSVPPKRAVTLHLPTPLHDQLARGAGELELLKTLINLEAVTADAPAGPSAPFLFESAECQLSNLADAVDAGAERSRLGEEIAQLDKSIKALDGRLSNPGYTEKAPAHLVQQTRDQLDRAKADRDAARDALDRLG
ncbi:MAG: class I tRNA ligase family protein, partial [Planctomycetota bacterium]